MIPKKAFERLLGLDECWEVSAAEYDTEPVERFLLVVHETNKLWPKLTYPLNTSRHQKTVRHDHTEARVWRHLGAFGKRTEVLCRQPRARCCACRHVWKVPLLWEGENKHFTRDFKAFELTLMREMPMKKTGGFLGENDSRLWCMLFAHVEKAHQKLDLSELVHLGSMR